MGDSLCVARASGHHEGASWDYAAGYLVVRGICDYGDLGKNDLWHNHAAIVAAGFTKALGSIDTLLTVAVTG